ncbi:glycoside hydrolase family 79 protein, partial [Amanita muscaria Koide BX008]
IFCSDRVPLCNKILGHEVENKHRACAIYEKGSQAAMSAKASGANYTGPAAYNPTTLQVPPVPTGFPTQVNAQILDGSASPGSSIPLMRSFFGFSIEMSVVDRGRFLLRADHFSQVGQSSQMLNVPFLNLMANLVRRLGRVNIRVGGNTQETAVLVQNTRTGKLLQKDHNNTLGMTNSPPIHYKENLLYIISSFLNVRWFLGIPFNNSNPYNLDIVHYGQSILGENLIGLQAGNEPDFYGTFGKRPA